MSHSNDRPRVHYPEKVRMAAAVCRVQADLCPRSSPPCRGQRAAAALYCSFQEVSHVSLSFAADRRAGRGSQVELAVDVGGLRRLGRLPQAALVRRLGVVAAGGAGSGRAGRV